MDVFPETALARGTPYTHLIGRPGGRQALPTPALLVDIDALERNITRMADFAQRQGIALRPHIKTHKCLQIAQRQLAAGARGVSCATLDEAEILAVAGISGILVTSPLVSDDKLARFLALLDLAPDTLLAVDHPDAATRLAACAAASGKVVNVLADVDLGHHRSGARTAAQIRRLIAAIQALPALRLAGIQAYGGHLQHVPDLAERTRLAQEASAIVSGLKETLDATGAEGLIFSGGGTGTHRIDAVAGIFTELQVGSYVFMDMDYGRIDLGLAQADRFEVALFVRACVTSVNCSENEPGSAPLPERFVSVDAGTKSFALNGPVPRCATAPWENCGFRFMGDEHAHLIARGDEPLPRLGEAVEFVVSHCDPTVHHFDHFYVVRGDTVVDIWSVDARGRR